MSRRLACLASLLSLSVLLVLAVTWSGQAYADRISRLIQILETDPSYKVRLKVVIALGKGSQRDRRVVPALIKALSDKNHLVRGLAAAALEKKGDVRALPGLRRLLEREKNSFVRERTKRAIRRLSPRVASSRRPRLYVTVGKLYDRSGAGGARALRILAGALRKEFARASGVTTRWSGSGNPTAEELERRRMKGFILGGGIHRLTRRRSGRQLEISCSLRISLSTYPGNSMKAVYSGETSLATTSREDRPERVESLYREIFFGAAREARQQIVRRYLHTQ